MNTDTTYTSQHPYDNWKAVTESDFVTLFIKTWFAFVSTLRELYPHSKPYYLAAGDSSYVESYKDDFSEKFYFLCSPASAIEPSLHKTYEHGLEIISRKYPRFLIKDFYYINLGYSDKYEEAYNIGGYSGTLSLLVNCASDDYINVTLKCDDIKFLEKAGEDRILIQEKINYSSILDTFVIDLEYTPRSISETALIHFFYDKLFQEIIDTLVANIYQKETNLPARGYFQIRTIFQYIQSFCQRAINSLKESCMNPEIKEDHKLLSQKPITNFLQSCDSMTSQDEQNAYVWFIGFVYRLRNALFHEIIDPLNPSWQSLFKNAYLVLKQVVDANIKRLKTISSLEKDSIAVYEKDFKKDPPPTIPINDDTIFSTNKVQVERYDQKGAKVSIESTILHDGISYLVKCNVKWDDKLTKPTVKNVEISP